MGVKALEVPPTSLTVFTAHCGRCTAGHGLILSQEVVNAGRTSRLIGRLKRHIDARATLKLGCPLPDSEEQTRSWTPLTSG